MSMNVNNLLRDIYSEGYSEIRMPELETFVVPEGPVPDDDPQVGQLFRTGAGRAHMTEAVRAQLAQNFQEETRRRMNDAMQSVAAGGFSRRVSNVTHQNERGLRPGVVIMDEQASDWDMSEYKNRSHTLINGSEVVTCFGDYKGIVGKVEKVEWSKDQNDFLVTIKFESHLETVRGEYVFRK